MLTCTAPTLPTVTARSQGNLMDMLAAYVARRPWSCDRWPGEGHGDCEAPTSPHRIEPHTGPLGPVTADAELGGALWEGSRDGVWIPVWVCRTCA